MKKILFLTAIFIVISTVDLNSQNSWDKNDRNVLLDGLINTKSELLAEISELNESQISFKPDAKSWSIGEVIEHLAVYEEHLYWDLLYQQHTPERPDLADKVNGNDEKLLAYATDPAKGSAPWLAEPIGRFTTKQELVHYFTKFRDRVIELVKETNTDFRLHFIYRSPSNSIWDLRDLHQYTLVWIAHTERHTEQIRRVKNSINYPKDKLWTEKDREFVYENMLRTMNEMIEETENISNDQWHFKPNKDSWNIAQVVEHMGLYERIVMQEAAVANALPPRPELYKEARSDEEFLEWMADKNPHVAPKNATPLGLMKGSDNLNFFLFGRELILDYLKHTEKDLKAQFTLRGSEPNRHRSVHGLIVVHFGHNDRHLRQIARIKADPNYPSN